MQCTVKTSERWIPKIQLFNVSVLLWKFRYECDGRLQIAYYYVSSIYRFWCAKKISDLAEF